MKSKTKNPVLEVFRAWNALLGGDKWNLPGVNSRTQKRWFDGGHTITAVSAKTVAIKVFERVAGKGLEPLRKEVFSAVLKQFPDAPVSFWTNESCGAWFRSQVEALDRNPETEEGSVPLVLSASVKRELREAYLRHLAGDCGYLKLQVIDQSAAKAGKRPLHLDRVYIDLFLEEKVRQETSFAKHLEESARPRTAPGEGRPGTFPGGTDTSSPKELRAVPVLEALGCLNRWVLLGAPGSGKSTITNFVSLELAKAGLGDQSALAKLGKFWKLGAILPVRLVLRQFAAWLEKKNLPGKGRAGHLWEFLREEVNYDSRRDQTLECLRQTAQDTGILFLLDGLDEVRDESSRWRMFEAVIEFVHATGPKCRFFLTSRPYAWDDLVDTLRKWEGDDERVRRSLNLTSGQADTLRELVQSLGPVYRLAPLEDDQIAAFIGRWYGAVQEACWLKKTEAATKTEELISAAGTDRPDLHELARNPLLLTLMATLHTNRARLPEDREDLYNEVVELLLQRWNETSGADQGLLEALEMRDLKLGDLREVMQKLAFDAHRASSGKSGLADIAENVLLGELKPLLRNSSDKAEIALRYIEDRAGLLLGQGERGRNRQYTFPHRTFQEYLAACYLSNHPDFYALATDLARENCGHWWEVLPLAARHARVNRGVPCADVLVGRTNVEQVPKLPISDADWRAAMLAARQLLEIGLAPINTRAEHILVRERVVGWLIRLLEHGALAPPERAKAGILLGQLGDPRPGVGLTLEGPLQGIPDISWVRVQAGPFIMGGKRGWQGGREFECGLIKVDYEISRYPVTCGQYAAFVADGGYREPKLIHDGGYWTSNGLAWIKQEKVIGPENYASVFQTPNHPLVGVSWYEAVAFCVWLSRKTGEEIRLPSEAEWERAARGREGRAFPWGAIPDGEDVTGHLAIHCNCEMSGIGSTSAVGLFSRGDTFPLEPEQSFGISDLSGNVLEWCGTKWVRDYVEYENQDLQAVDGNEARVLRGGSWGFVDSGLLMSSLRNYYVPDIRCNYVGFRVVRVLRSALTVAG